MNSEIENGLAIYYDLLSKNSQDSSLEEKMQLNNLEEKLNKFQIFGKTKRERLLYKLIDKELSKDSQKYYNEWSEESVNEITEKILKELKVLKND
jgi:protoheme ferro-lyase